MADKPKAPQRRRGFKLEGQGPESEEPDRIRPRAVDDAFRLANKDEAVEVPEGGQAYPAHLMEAFQEGRITLGDLEGITKQEQYQMAEIGHGYMNQRKLDEAKVVFEGLLALDPFDAFFNMALGSVAQQQNRPEDADSLYSRALEINPYSPTSWANRGEVRVMQGDLQKGVEDLLKAVELDPRNAEPATERARATLMVLREQLSGLDTAALKKRAEEATKPKIPVAKARPRSQTARPRSGVPRQRPRSGTPRASTPRASSPRSATPRARGPSRGPSPRGPRSK